MAFCLEFSTSDSYEIILCAPHEDDISLSRGLIIVLLLLAVDRIIYHHSCWTGKLQPYLQEFAPAFTPVYGQFRPIC
uniref:Uncharacterized protein n=1 Tax=Oryza brachyantha TaxID=4533 RepID=J3M579_ORYBR